MSLFRKESAPSEPEVDIKSALLAIAQYLSAMDGRMESLERKMDVVYAAYEGLNPRK